MRESKYIWFDGDLVPWKDAKVHVLTHALHYGTGAFEGIRAYSTPAGPAVLAWVLLLLVTRARSVRHLVSTKQGGKDESSRSYGTV